jgi:hypothetical protein
MTKLFPFVLLLSYLDLSSTFSWFFSHNMDSYAFSGLDSIQALFGSLSGSSVAFYSIIDWLFSGIILFPTTASAFLMSSFGLSSVAVCCGCLPYALNFAGNQGMARHKHFPYWLSQH